MKDQDQEKIKGMEFNAVLNGFKKNHVGFDSKYIPMVSAYDAPVEKGIDPQPMVLDFLC